MHLSTPSLSFSPFHIAIQLHLRVFNIAYRRDKSPLWVTSDPLFRYHRWQANLRILGIRKIKSIPYTLVSHPFVERLIGTIRREFIDHTLFWNGSDLQKYLTDFQMYYNHNRTHSSLGSDTPAEVAGGTPKHQTKLNYFRWQTHCRGLYQLPAAD